LDPFYYDRLEHAHGSAARFALEQLLVALEQLLVVASVVLRHPGGCDVLLHVARTNGLDGLLLLINDEARYRHRYLLAQNHKGPMTGVSQATASITRPKGSCI